MQQWLKKFVNGTLLIENESAMQQCACELATQLKAGSVIALDGDLGAGKTRFCKGLAQGLGIQQTLASPTFPIVQEYPNPGGLALYHFDFYRLQSAEELIMLGWDDYLEAAGVVVVEWAGRFPELFTQDTLWLQILHQANDTRLLQLRQPQQG